MEEIGVCEYIILSNYKNSDDFVAYDYENAFIFQKDDIEFVDKNSIIKGKNYYIKRKNSNIILKNKLIYKYSDKVYIIYKPKYFNPKNIDINNIYGVYGYIKIDTEPSKIIKPEISFPLNLHWEVLTNKNFINEKYNVEIMNYNCDTVYPINDKFHKINLNKFNELFSIYCSDNKINLIYKQKDSTYPGIIYCLKDYNCTLTVFKTFKIKYSGSSYNNILTVNNLIKDFITKNYNEILLSTFNIDMNTMFLEELSINDL